jgi:hypothetical protein
VLKLSRNFRNLSPWSAQNTSKSQKNEKSHKLRFRLGIVLKFKRSRKSKKRSVFFRVEQSYFKTYTILYKNLPITEKQFCNGKSVFGKFISSDEKRNLKKNFRSGPVRFPCFQNPNTHIFIEQKSNTFFSAVFFESKRSCRLGFVLIFYDFQIEQFF